MSLKKKITYWSTKMDLASEWISYMTRWRYDYFLQSGMNNIFKVI